MNYAIEKITKKLKTAREQKGLSQRALSARAGVPQSHISKIENDAVDLRLSSFTAIAYALNLEIVLVPCKALPAVKSVTRSVGALPTVDPAVAKELHKIRIILKSIAPRFTRLEETMRLQQGFREISQFENLFDNHIDKLRNFRKTLHSINMAGGSEAIERASEQVNALRNALAHAQSTVSYDHPTRPAYQLDGSNDG